MADQCKLEYRNPLAAGYVRLNFKQYGPAKGDLLQDKRKENYWESRMWGYHLCILFSKNIVL